MNKNHRRSQRYLALKGVWNGRSCFIDHPLLICKYSVGATVKAPFTCAPLFLATLHNIIIPNPNDTLYPNDLNYSVVGIGTRYNQLFLVEVAEHDLRKRLPFISTFLSQFNVPKHDLIKKLKESTCPAGWGTLKLKVLEEIPPQSDGSNMHRIMAEASARYGLPILPDFKFND